jgi:F420-non-reducing hydrogenase small subunit
MQLASCWGCHQSIVDMHLELLDILPLLDIVYWQAVVDTKHDQLEALPDGYIDVGFVEGHIRTKHDTHLLKVIRKKSKLLIALGDCSTHGGVAGLSNLFPIEENTKRKYITAETVVDNFAIPSENVPEFEPKVIPNKDIVKFDAFLYGCPPTSENLKAAVLSLVPVLLDKKYLDTNVCSVCAMRGAECLLKKGIPCFGSITGAPPGLKWTAEKGPVMGEYGTTNNVAQPEANDLLKLAAGIKDVTEDVAKIILEFAILYFRLPNLGQVYLSADVLQAAAQGKALPTKMIGGSVPAVDLSAITPEMVGPALAPVFTGLPAVVKDIVGAAAVLLTKCSAFKPGLQNVCAHCDRNDGNIKLVGYKRDYEGIKDQKTCLLNQGYICLGFLTNAGCGAKCPNANSPCIGCYGPMEEIVDNPEKYNAKIQSILSEGTVDDLVNKMVDPVGVFYKASYARTKI